MGLHASSPSGSGPRGQILPWRRVVTPKIRLHQCSVQLARAFPTERAPVAPPREAGIVRPWTCTKPPRGNESVSRDIVHAVRTLTASRHAAAPSRVGRANAAPLLRNSSMTSRGIPLLGAAGRGTAGVRHTRVRLVRVLAMLARGGALRVRPSSPGHLFLARCFSHGRGAAAAWQERLACSGCCQRRDAGARPGRVLWWAGDQGGLAQQPEAPEADRPGDKSPRPVRAHRNGWASGRRRNRPWHSIDAAVK